MWFKDLDKIQFTMYAKQEARLNTAYWLAAFVLHKCDTCSPTALVRSEIMSFKGQAMVLLRYVHRDLDQLHDLPQRIIQDQFEYIVSFCQHSLRDTNKRFRYVRRGIEIPGDYAQAKNEMAFIRARAELIDEEDLLEQWDRSIYLIYDAINLYKVRHSVPEYKREIRRRFNASIQLMRPGHEKIQQYCQSYIHKLELDAGSATVLTKKQVIQYSGMFEAGLALAHYSSELLSTRHRIMAIGQDLADFKKYQQESEDKGNDIQEGLIRSNLARTNSILRVIDRRI